jgi:hypothetical protein
MRVSGTAIASWLLLACATIRTRAAVQADPEMKSIQVSIFACVFLQGNTDQNDSCAHIAFHQYVAPWTEESMTSFAGLLANLPGIFMLTQQERN